MQEERKRADFAVELERAKVDEAIEQERKAKSALAGQTLEQERKRTDHNLSKERARTDAEVLTASGLLSDEISEHEKTRIALTTREEFLAIVSHDLRNPIGTASMCADLLLKNPRLHNLTSDAIRSIELIKRNVDASLRLIADLLDMERIGGGKLELNLEKHCIGEIIRDSIEAFANQAAEKNVTLEAAHSISSGEVACDRDRILQVLSNLIGNALKFTPTNGKILINTLYNESEVQISVSDTGSGIPDEKKEQIFTRFAQLGQNDRRGLGLGLYISKMLVEEHHGKLWLQSKLGEGSTFYFSIPRKALV